MDRHPRVTVIVPAYNIRPYIAAALTSLERQTLADFEALVVDDGSTDGTAEVVEPFCRRDGRFRLLRKANGGLSSARNWGLHHARADYIALLDGDDAYAPGKLEAHAALLDTHPEVAVVYSASRVMRDDGRLTGYSLSGRPVHPDPVLALLCKNFVGHGSNAVFRRSLVEVVGAFDETLRSAEDMDFWLRVAAANLGGFWRDPRPLVHYRVRPGGLSFNVAQMQRSAEQVLEAAYRRTPERVQPILPTARAYQCRFLARLALTAGDLESAQRFIDRAWAEDASIFWQDPRSLVTLVAVRLAPMAKLGIRQMLGSTAPSRR